MTVRVRPARPSDLEGIVEVYNAYVTATPATFETTAVSPEGRRPWLEDHRRGGRHRIFVAESGPGLLVGWATTSPFRPRAAYDTTVESSVYCRPGWTGRGIGSRLYDRLFDAIREEDVERVVAGITLPNPGSVALHRRFGFREVGVFSRVGRKLGRYWDVAWFERPCRLDGQTRGEPAARATGPVARAPRR